MGWEAGRARNRRRGPRREPCTAVSDRCSSEQQEWCCRPQAAGPGCCGWCFPMFLASHYRIHGTSAEDPRSLGLVVS